MGKRRRQQQAGKVAYDWPAPSISRRFFGCTPLLASQPSHSMERPSGFLPPGRSSSAAMALPASWVSRKRAVGCGSVMAEAAWAAAAVAAAGKFKGLAAAPAMLPAGAPWCMTTVYVPCRGEQRTTGSLWVRLCL